MYIYQKETLHSRNYSELLGEKAFYAENQDSTDSQQQMRQV
jgi:hypothetical protein